MTVRTDHFGDAKITGSIAAVLAAIASIHPYNQPCCACTASIPGTDCGGTTMGCRDTPLFLVAGANPLSVP